MPACNCRQPSGNIPGEFLSKWICASGSRQAAGNYRLAAGAPRPSLADEKTAHPAAQADTCILLWMGGGMASPETFDPKRYTEFEVGIPSEQILCTFIKT